MVILFLLSPYADLVMEDTTIWCSNWGVCQQGRHLDGDHLYIKFICCNCCDEDVELFSFSFSEKTTLPL